MGTITVKQLIEILNKSLSRIEIAVDENSKEINEIKVEIAKLGGTHNG